MLKLRFRRLPIRLGHFQPCTWQPSPPPRSPLGSSLSPVPRPSIPTIPSTPLKVAAPNQTQTIPSGHPSRSVPPMVPSPGSLMNETLVPSYTPYTVTTASVPQTGAPTTAEGTAFDILSHSLSSFCSSSWMKICRWPGVLFVHRSVPVSLFLFELLGGLSVNLP